MNDHRRLRASRPRVNRYSRFTTQATLACEWIGFLFILAWFGLLMFDALR